MSRVAHQEQASRSLKSTFPIHFLSQNQWKTPRKVFGKRYD
jgi:hypothetical protein